MQKSWLNNFVVEFVGTFALIFVGAGAIIATGGQNLVAIALAHGLAIGLMVAAAGHISGGVYNPSVTIALVTVRSMRVARGIYYIVAQLVGATVGALTLKIVFPTAAVAAVNLGTPAVASGIGTTAAAAAEIIMTFFLVYAVFGVAVDLRGARAMAGAGDRTDQVTTMTSSPERLRRHCPIASPHDRSENRAGRTPPSSAATAYRHLSCGVARCD